MPGGNRGRGKPGGGTRGTFNTATGIYRISGVEVAFDPELNYDVNKKPTPLFPDYQISPPTQLTAKEKKQVAHFRAVRSAIHEGPYYSVLGDNARVEKASKKAAANVDPFVGVPTYSQRYTKERKTLPRLDAKPHVLKFFPKELWSILDPKAGLTNGAAINGETRKLKMARSKFHEGASQIEEKMEADGDDLEGAKKDVNDDEEDPMEDAVVDDEFEEDEDEGGDYNAEGYFDDGGDDADDFGGDDEGGGEY